MDITQLGPYRITEKLGEGAMGTVYLGVHEQTGQADALKLLAGRLAERRTFRARFESEIESLRKLEHPNIVRCYGFGEQDGMLFYAMEHVPGTNLDEQLESGRWFDWREVVRIGTQICAALKHAHDRGIIHRDLKPANLLLTGDEQVKLADFGIAHLYGHAGMTMAGGPIGTATFMSPEQTDGSKVTQHADLYSLGCVLYTLLARRPPFVADSLTQMLHMQQSETPDPIRKHVPDTPAALELVVSRLLEKAPTDRYAHAGIAARALQAVEDAVDLHATQSARPKTPAFTTDESETSDDTAPARVIDDTALAEIVDDQAATVAHVPADTDTGRARETASPPAEDEPTLLPPAMSRAAVGQHDDGKDDGLYELAEVPVKPARRVPGRTGKPAPGSTFRLAELDSQTPADKRSVFVTATDADRQDREIAEEEERARPRIISTGTIVFCLILIAVAIGTSVYMRPPSADDLYQTIQDLVDEDASEDAYIEAEDHAIQFERLYHDDPRLEQLEPIRERAKLIRLGRRTRNKARYLRRADTDSTIERTYIEAINIADVEPERGLAMLEAMIDLYNSPAVTKTPEVLDYLELAIKESGQIRKQINTYSVGHLLLIGQQLDYARKLQATNPKAAQKICLAIIELYEAKPWARQRVAEAASLLTEIADAADQPENQDASQ